MLAVGYHDQLAVHPFGSLTRDAKAPKVTANTIYDLASLTKVVVTTTSAMMLVQQKRLDLDAPVERYLPEFSAAAKSDPNPTWRARITVRMLMLHDSGLPAHRDFYKDAKGHEAVLARVMAEPLVHEPGTQVEYSDLGFILLGEIIERLTGETLAQFAKGHIFAPLGMSDTLYNPPASLRARIAPTELDADFRKRLLRGEVHDENAFALGGVSGNAGLFSTRWRRGGVCADAAERRHLWASPFADTRDDSGIYGAPSRRRFGENSGLGRADAAKFRRRTLFFAGQFWTHRIHRNIALD